MFYQNYSHAYQFEQNRKSAECEKKFIELRKELYELDELQRQFAPYMQPADLQKRITKKTLRCAKTFADMGELFSELDCWHRQMMTQRCMVDTLCCFCFAA